MPVFVSLKYFSKRSELIVFLVMVEGLSLMASIVFAFYFKNPFLIGVIFLIATAFVSSLLTVSGALIIALINIILTQALFLFYFYLEQRFLAITHWSASLPLFLPLFLIISYLIGGFNVQTRQLKKEIKERTRELEEAKTFLEIKVKTRTRELEELTKNLEEEVKKRTKELQEKVDELERFQKLAVGRELKMMKMKKEVKNLKEELEKCKKTSEVKSS